MRLRITRSQPIPDSHTRPKAGHMNVHNFFLLFVIKARLSTVFGASVLQRTQCTVRKGLHHIIKRKIVKRIAAKFCRI